MKKLLAIILASVMILCTFTACNTTDNQPDAATTESEEQTSMEVTTEELTTVITTETETVIETETETEAITTETTTVEVTTVEETTTAEITTAEETTTAEITTLEETTTVEATTEETTVEETTLKETTLEETTLEETTTVEETESETVTETETESETETETETETESETETETEEETTEEVTTTFIDLLNISSENLSEAMQNMFADRKYMSNETLFFIDKGETKRLIYPATKIISVTSYDGKKVYTEGVDYILTEEGHLKVTENSSIPCITSAVYYNHSEQMISVNHNGQNKWIYWGEGNMMTKWQVCVNYEHDSAWDGYKQQSNITQYEGVIRKLMAGEDVTIMFYGDSITCGANASWFLGQEPSQGSYSMLFTEALADLFGYTVNYIDVSYLKPGMIKPTPAPYVGGTNGTITYINTAVGGWTSNDGYSNFNTFVKPFVEEYGCDLFVIAFGGNDAPGGIPATTIANNFKKIITAVKKASPDVHFMMIATMVTNTLATNGWYTPTILEHEAEFLRRQDTSTQRTVSQARLQI